MQLVTEKALIHRNAEDQQEILVTLMIAQMASNTDQATSSQSLSTSHVAPASGC